MNKKIFIYVMCLILLVGVVAILNISNNFKEKTNTIEATVLSKGDKTITVQDSNNSVYTFKTNNYDFDVGSKILIEYSGLINKDPEIKAIQLIEVKDFQQISGLGDKINPKWVDNGIFGTYYTLAFNKLKTMTLDERIAQVLLVRYPDNNPVELMKKYQFAGYIFYEKNFTGKNEQAVKKMINDVQNVAKIKALTAVDEEGGDVVRVSSNQNLVDSKFKSPSELYTEGGFDLIKNDTINKSNILYELGLNLNLAPVVDVTESGSDYIYKRALGKNTDLTSNYAKTVISASKNTGVSYTLKHFPGYGNNTDTHSSEAIDNRSREDIMKNDIPPFEAGINAGAEAVLVGHQTVANIDRNNPASLSLQIHDLLKDELNFTGVTISDDLDMGAVEEIDNRYVKALQAGNDLLIVSDYEKSFDEIKKAINNGSLNEDDLNKAAFKVIAWKYSKGLIYVNQK